MGQVLAEAEGYRSLLEEQTQALLQQLSKSPASDRISTEIKVIVRGRQTDRQTDRQTERPVFECGALVSC